ncbi:MAG: hypothetical protein ACRYGL_18425 [Janthinobacterium lividum]
MALLPGVVTLTGTRRLARCARPDAAAATPSVFAGVSPGPGVIPYRFAFATVTGNVSFLTGRLDRPPRRAFS